MSDIPSDLHREILLRLPAEPLLRLRSVCKSWRHTIDDPSFARSHFINNQRSSPNLLIKFKTDTDALCSLSLDSIIHANGEQTIDATLVNPLVRQDVARIKDFPVSTCNGLILISDYYENNKTWLIWNPFTDDFHELPRLEVEVISHEGCGIGYDSTSDDYKVVFIDSVSRDVYRTFVYSLRLNSWKRIMDCPVYLWADPGLFLNGALYWRSDGSIIVLDLATEQYRQIAQPPEWRFPWDTSMIVLDGCLILSVVGPTKRAWVMNDNALETWVELFSSVERHVIDGWRSELDWPIAYSKSQRQLILQNLHDNDSIVWDIEKFSAKIVTIHGIPVPHSSQIFPISIFRFKDRVDGVKRETNEANTRLKLSVTTSTDIPCHSVSDDSPGEEEEEDEDEDEED